MLKGIPKVLTPEMLKILCEMGHDDEIVIADAHFPAEAMGKRVIQYPCISAPEMVEAIVKVMPLDTYVKAPIMVMSLVQSDIDKGMPIPTMWEEVLLVPVRLRDSRCSSENMSGLNFMSMPRKPTQLYRRARNGNMAILCCVRVLC